MKTPTRPPTRKPGLSGSLAILIAITLLRGSVSADAVPVATSVLDGVWQVTSLETGGKEIPDAGKAIKLIFQGNDLTIKGQSMVDPNSIDSSKITIDTTKPPWTLDMVRIVNDKPVPEQTVGAIWKLEAETLTICLGTQSTQKTANAAVQRPASFATAAGTKEVLLKLSKETTAPAAQIKQLKAKTLDQQEAQKMRRRLTQIHGMLLVVASRQNGNFPDGKTSNEAFRTLCAKGLVDDEHIFSANPKAADQNIGDKASGYDKAVEPGECDISLVRGLNLNTSKPNLPLLFTSYKGHDGTIYVALSRVDGTCRIYETTDGIVKEEKDNTQVDVLSKAYGTIPENILSPAK
jgi:uncharacterized protein (TIGR03067 family)